MEAKLHDQPANTPPADDAEVLIEVSDVRKQYEAGGAWVLDGIDFSVSTGETVAIIGPSGCGKSTLLKVIAGLEEPTMGDVTLHDPNFTLVFQYSALFDSLTVFENVAFSMLETPDYRAKASGFKKLQGKELEEAVAEKLRLVGLEGIEDKYPNELSGGMQKRVSFARAIMSNPRIILYDEPTSGLDPLASYSLEDYINKLSDELQAASIVVTHTYSTICRTAHKVLFLEEGQIRWQGSPAEMIDSDDELVKRFTEAGTGKGFRCFGGL